MSVDVVAEILTQPERRRRWTSEQKLALVAETLRPGASPPHVARRYGILTGLLYTWRRLAREGELSLVPLSAPATAFIQVEIVPEASVSGEDATGAGVMVIELPGERRVRVDRHVDADADALRRVLLALGSTL
jgi:transposase